MKIDLHMHSTRSDGVLSPLALVEAAASRGVTVAAITDHDIMAAHDDLAGKHLPLRLIPGVELSLRDHRGLHLLGYGWGKDTPLQRRMAQLAEGRITRAREMAALMERAGMPIDMESMLAASAGTIGRMHMAREMVKLGYVRDAQEAFARYLKEGQPFYVPGERLLMREALNLMQRSGFVPVLAHPCLLNMDDMTLRAMIRAWVDQGLMGVEVYHPSAAGHGFHMLDALARRMNLLVTGGSDFHQSGDAQHGLPGCMAIHWRQAEQDLATLEAAMNH